MSSSSVLLQFSLSIRESVFRHLVEGSMIWFQTFSTRYQDKLNVLREWNLKVTIAELQEKFIWIFFSNFALNWEVFHEFMTYTVFLIRKREHLYWGINSRDVFFLNQMYKRIDKRVQFFFISVKFPWRSAKSWCLMEGDIIMMKNRTKFRRKRFSSWFIKII